MAEYEIGEKVKVIHSVHGFVNRVGIIQHIIYHKDSPYGYKVESDGALLSEAFLPHELIAVEIPQDLGVYEWLSSR
jgi:hypothetical protein